jgi:hypothetical protein
MSFRRRLVQDDGRLQGLSYKLIQGSSPTNVSTDPSENPQATAI